MKFPSRRIKFRLIILLYCMVLSLNSVRSTTAIKASCDPQLNAGTVEERHYTSALLKQDMRYSIYTPPCYEASERAYPVVYLLHGSNTDNTHWIKLGVVNALDQGIQAGKLPPMIVVMPYGDWIANKNRFDTISWGNVFITELMPDVEARFRIIDQRETRAIGGISRGGFWAFHLAFKHPELFSIVGGHSAFFDLYHAPKTDNPLDLALTAGYLDSLRISLDRGKNDYAAPNLDLMDERLTERGIPHDYTIYPEGQHNNNYWQAHVKDYLAFYAQEWYADMFSAPNTSTAAPRYRVVASGVTPNTVFIPAVAFGSFQANITSVRLQAIRSGQLDSDLVLDMPTRDALAQVGVSVAADTTIVAPEALDKTLWQNRKLFTLLPFDRLTQRVRMLRVDESVPVNFILDDPQHYPLAFTSSTPNFDPAKLTRFMLSGVTAVVRDTAYALDDNGIQWAGEALRPITTRADFFHVSNEVSFHPTCADKDRAAAGALGPFCTKQYVFDLLPYLGVDVVELTGNHNLDFGVQAYLDTLALYKQAGIVTVGGGANLTEARQAHIFEHHGNRIGFLACNWAGPGFALAKEDYPGAAFCDRPWVKEALADLKAKTDVVLVSVQYRETDFFYPIDQQRFDFHDLADWGADMVIGSQAHKPQTFEMYISPRGASVFLHYGLGNVYFDQTYFQKRFFMDEVYIYDKQLLTVDLYAGIIDKFGRPRLMNDYDRDYFMRTIFSQSAF